MIQRIQSIFLVLAAGLLGSLFALPFSTSSGEAGYAEASVYGDQVFEVADHLGLMIAFGLAGVLALIAIFLFKNRPWQIRLGIVAIIVTVLGIGFGGYLLYEAQALELGGLNLKPAAIFPLLAIIFLALANRYIRKDEKTVKAAYTRLR